MLGFILYVKAITNSFISSTYIFHISSKKKKRGLNAILVNQLCSGIDSTAELKPNQFKKKSFNAIHIGSVKKTVKSSLEPKTNLCD